VNALLALLLLAPQGPPALPDRIFFKSPTRSFTATHSLALEDGRLWWKANGNNQHWGLVPPDGLPISHGRLESIKELVADFPGAPEPFVRPQRLVELTADGENVVVVSDEGLVFYAKLPGLEWTHVWGPLGFKKPLKIDFLHRGLAISHRKQAYQDIDGNSHPVTVGVTTFYALSGDGRTLSYTDPWLPPTFAHRLCLPRRNQFVAEALSASASTIFVIDAAGHGFTRLADFDTVGLDPTMPYSWERARRSGLKSVIRSLPPEDWVEQPTIPGKTTTRITVLQTGEGNRGRELRVEGESGYWRKPIAAPNWEFVMTTEGTLGIWADPSIAFPAAEPLPVYAGTFKDMKAQLRELDVDCSPAKVQLTLGKEVLDLELHFRGTGRHLKGALILAGKPSPRAKKLLKGKRWAEVDIELGESSVVVSDPSMQLRFSRVQ
jgi:hypothetical protein